MKYCVLELMKSEVVIKEIKKLEVIYNCMFYIMKVIFKSWKNLFMMIMNVWYDFLCIIKIMIEFMWNFFESLYF